MVTLADIRAAQDLLRGVAVQTPLFEWTHPEDPKKLFLKLENLQPIGAFKLRGAYNKVASFSPEERGRGVVSYSSGNHGQGVAYAARALGTRAVVVMPDNAPTNKIEATRKLGAEIILVGPGSEERRLRAEELASQHGYVIVPPYDDEKIIAGQGTVGLEILEDLPAVETVLVPVGGGGLISGVAAAIKLSATASSASRVRVIGVEPEIAADAVASFRSGHIVSSPSPGASQTIADGLRTQSIGARNFEHIQAYVDDIVSVTEGEIFEATRILAENSATLAEPSGAVAAAAFLFHRFPLPDTSLTAAVVSGGNLDPSLLPLLKA